MIGTNTYRLLTSISVTGIGVIQEECETVKPMPIKNWEKSGFWAPSQYKEDLSIDGDFRYRDKTIIRPFYLYNWSPDTGKTAFLYCDSPQMVGRDGRNFTNGSLCHVPSILYISLHMFCAILQGIENPISISCRTSTYFYPSFIGS